jgi:hypothetical protein
MPTAPNRPIPPAPVPTLHLAPGLGNTGWTCAFGTTLDQPPRLRTMVGIGPATASALVARVYSLIDRQHTAVNCPRPAALSPHGGRRGR